MKILALDSTAQAASAAVWEDGTVRSYFVAESGQTHSEVLLPMAQAALSAVHLTPEEIDYFAVTVGPGSFTGVRIGVATVKGLAFRLPAPADASPKENNCVAVSALEALARNLLPTDGIYCPVMDARRGEAYTALFKAENGALVRLCPDRALPVSDLAEELHAAYPDTPVYLCGDGYDLARKAFLAAGIHTPETPLLLRTQNAASVALCAADAIKEGRTTSDRTLSPVYLRLPQAERERLEREKQNEETK